MEETTQKIRIRSDHIVIALVAIVLVVSLVQSFQIQELKENSIEGESVAQITTESPSQPKPTVQRIASPVMVGGC